MKPGLIDYTREAFNARPIGMFVPPNWIGLGLFGLLGLVNPGFWVIGLGLELAYLGALASNERFQRWVDATRQWEKRREWHVRVEDLVKQLSEEGQRRYRALEVRCRSILELQHRTAMMSSGLDAQGEGLGRLLWIYLRLLLIRQAIDRILREADESPEEAARLETRLESLQAQVEDTSIGEDLRRSLRGQLEILQQRLQKRVEARDKIVVLDAELTRIQEQVELIREQAVLSADPEVMSQRIDQIADTLGGTTEWIREQQQIYGAVEDLLTEPPPLSVQLPAKESQ